jgi:cytochrome c-type biogenesis protein CcmH
MLWILIAVMLTAAVLIVAVPLYRAEKHLSVTMVLSIIVVTALSAVIYSQIGTPNPAVTAHAQAGGQAPGMDEMVVSLSARLQDDPDDLQGWKMLGRSHFSMRNFPDAIAAFEKAVDLESGQDGQTLTDLGEAVLYDDGASIVGRAGEIFENAIALSPNNPKALFYAGMAAVQRGDSELGAERWETLLATSPPPNVQEILRQQIAELRGESPDPEPVPEPVVETIAAGTIAAGINVDVSLGESAVAASLPDATVFVIVRDPAQPSPPIAAIRVRLAELPTTVSVSDSNAMVPGRVPSGFDRLEFIARVSLTGQPMAASGDWFGDAVVETTGTDNVKIVIDQQIP